MEILLLKMIGVSSMSLTTMTKEISGVLSVFQTPFLESGEIDFKTLRGELDWLFAQGADGLVMAMVSEVLRLSSEERDQVATAACTAARDNGGSCVISVGAESTMQAVRHAKHAERTGADALMAIPPVATACGEAELRKYFVAILESVEIPLIVQDASGYVGRPMSIDFQAGLMNEFGADRVLFKPEAVPLGQRLSELRDATSGKAKIFEGSGGIALVDSFTRGIAGTMPGADLIRGLVPLWKALEAGDRRRADTIHGPLSALVSLQSGLDGFLAVEKYLLKRQGVFENEIVRGPVGFILDDETRREVDRLFDQMIEAVEKS